MSEWIDVHAAFDQMLCEARANKVRVISAKSLAQSLLPRLDPAMVAPTQLRHWAIEGLTVIARARLRVWFPSPEEEARRDEDNAASGAIFEAEELQPMYPVTREKEHVYVEREMLTLAERRALIEGYRRMGRKYVRKADALQAETDALGPVAA